MKNEQSGSPCLGNWSVVIDVPPRLVYSSA